MVASRWVLVALLAASIAQADQWDNADASDMDTTSSLPKQVFPVLEAHKTASRITSVKNFLVAEEDSYPDLKVKHNKDATFAKLHFFGSKADQSAFIASKDGAPAGVKPVASTAMLADLSVGEIRGVLADHNVKLVDALADAENEEDEDDIDAGIEEGDSETIRRMKKKRRARDRKKRQGRRKKWDPTDVPGDFLRPRGFLGQVIGVGLFTALCFGLWKLYLYIEATAESRELREAEATKSRDAKRLKKLAKQQSRMGSR